MSIESQIYELVSRANPEDPLRYVEKIVKPICKTKLDNAIMNCSQCGICNSTKSITKGNPNASVLIIAESVSLMQQESSDNVVLPLEDKSGEYLDNVLNYLKVNREQIFMINSVNCYPNRDGAKRPSTVAERSECKVFLDYAIKTVEPLMIICLGATAVNGINEEIGKQKITEIRGRYFSYRGMNVMPTFHPGYFDELLKRDMPEDMVAEYHNNFIDDIERAFKDLQEMCPDINLLLGEGD